MSKIFCTFIRERNTIQKYKKKYQTRKKNMINLIQISEEQFSNMLQSAAYIGAITALKNAGVPVKELFSITSMYKMHGRKRVDKLIRDGKLTPKSVEGSANKLYSEQEYQSLIQ